MGEGCLFRLEAESKEQKGKKSLRCPLGIKKDQGKVLQLRRGGSAMVSRSCRDPQSARRRECPSGVRGGVLLLDRRERNGSYISMV